MTYILRFEVGHLHQVYLPRSFSKAISFDLGKASKYGEIDSKITMANFEPGGSKAIWNKIIFSTTLNLN